MASWSRRHYRNQQEDGFDTWSRDKKLAATLNGLEKLKPEELTRNQYNKLLNRCAAWTGTQQQDSAREAPEEDPPGRAVKEWEKIMELMDQAQVQYIPKSMLQQMKAAVDRLEDKVGREAGRRYWDEMPSVTPTRRDDKSRTRSRDKNRRRKEKKSHSKVEQEEKEKKSYSKGKA